MEKSEKVKIAKESRLYRADQRLRQVDLAKMCGVSQRTISFIETETWNKVSEENILAVKKILIIGSRA